eukprot:CAMPEP_0170594900 /NCGR_PEP_ID=MMETSP0224-20130122/14254_1 /TAXON_ID=285029 /ORGANISM="Togula jolla, Strain CCCM 725" /LENGTH=392 /DNA_ID=CAMNT_0010919003 /DNA_START=367 /DNA_END=1547 /DNA_ORIENTATION=-
MATGVVVQIFYLYEGGEAVGINKVDILLVYAIIAFVVAFTSSYLAYDAPLRPSPDVADSAAVRARIRIIFSVIVISTLILALVSLTPMSFHMHRLFSLGLLAVFLVPALTPLRWPCLPQSPDAYDSHAVSLHSSHEVEKADLGVFETLRTLDCWLLLFVSTVLIGGGMMLSTNFAQIAEAISRCNGQDLAPRLVTLFSCSQSLARLAVGYFSDMVLNAGWGLPRPVMLVIACIMMGLGHICVYRSEATGDDSWVIAGTLLAAPAFGAIWPMMVILSSEFFGSRRLSENYMIFDGIAGAVAFNCISNLLASSVFAQAPKVKEADAKASAMGSPASASPTSRRRTLHSGSLRGHDPQPAESQALHTDCEASIQEQTFSSSRGELDLIAISGLSL